jgi:hypothetical protein
MLVPSLVFRRLQADDASVPFAGHSKYVRVTMRYLRCCGTVPGSSRSNSSRIRKSRMPSNNLWFAISSSHRHHWTNTIKSHKNEVHHKEEILKIFCFHYTTDNITYSKLCTIIVPTKCTSFYKKHKILQSVLSVLVFLTPTCFNPRGPS